MCPRRRQRCQAAGAAPGPRGTGTTVQPAVHSGAGDRPGSGQRHDARYPARVAAHRRESRDQRIIAPDLLYNPNFGCGLHGRIYDYPSEDKQWSLVAGLKQRVEREFDAEYQLGRLPGLHLDHRTSITIATARRASSASATTRCSRNETNYTSQQDVLQAQVGWNLTPDWQLLYTFASAS